MTSTDTYQSRVHWGSLLTSHLSVCTRSGNAAQAHWTDHPLCKETGNDAICKTISNYQSNYMYIAIGNALKCVIQTDKVVLK